MKTYKIHLIRHGLTDANESGKYIGITDLPLSPNGFTSLLNLKSEGKYPTVRRFFTSPLNRCKQTLTLLYPDAKPDIVPGLSECDFGDWEGKDVRQLGQDEMFRKWASGMSAEIPNGESAADFERRVSDAFETIVNSLITSGETDAVVCTHGGVIMMIMAKYAYPQHQIHEWACGAGMGFSLRITPTLWMREPVAEFMTHIPDMTHVPDMDK